ncbi:MAG: type II 3-dehydroquinate dehydratase [Firmicutes bacterium]|nr:type II 3-dehydroquinate dehydratase [Bacillota bacterium]
MKILVINGSNINMLGVREPELYGDKSLNDLYNMIIGKCMELDVDVDFYQSNHEGNIVDRIQQAYGRTDGIIINGGAYSHTSVAILDALKAVGIPAVEVHLTDTDEREDFRKFSYISLYAMKTVKGKGFEGYLEAVEILTAYDRVRHMEEIMDRVAEAIANGSGRQGIEEDIKTLENYYETKWRADFEMDEEGVFPKEMKRGILSEDGLYDILTEASRKE